MATQQIFAHSRPRLARCTSCTWQQRERLELAMLRAPRVVGDRNLLRRRGRYYKLGRGFHNRRAARFHAETIAGIGAGDFRGPR